MKLLENVILDSKPRKDEYSVVTKTVSYLCLSFMDFDMLSNFVYHIDKSASGGQFLFHHFCAQSKLTEKLIKME